MVVSILLAAALAPATPPVEAVVAAERAFAAAAHDHGIAAAFLDTMDPDHAIRLTPAPQPALAFWRAQTQRSGPPYLTWRPTWAGASRCGDLGFTTGPYSYDDKAFGYYFTIWTRRSDGAPFKWVLDSGVELAPDPRVPADAPVVFAAAASGRWTAVHPDSYSGQVASVDDRLDAALARTSKRAYGRLLAQDARAMGPGRPGQAIGRAEVLTAIDARPAIRAGRLGVVWSQCGDLAATWGTADWTADGRPVNGNYVRIWRRAGPRWTLLFDELNTPG
jgi:hypothetical protein